MQELSGLPEPWREFFRLAWEAYRAGSIPCGSVIVDASRALVARGRNRALELDAPSGQLANTSLAHAEINAIAQLPVAPRPDHILYSSLEPCLLCLGAVVMSSLGGLRFAGLDLWSGSTRAAVGDIATVDIPQVTRNMPWIEGPLPGEVGLFGSALYLEWLMRRNPQGPVVVLHRERGHEAVALADRLRQTRLLEEAAVTNRSLEEIWPEVWRL